MQAVKEFKESYDKDILSSVISNYSEKMHRFSKARDFLLALFCKFFNSVNFGSDKRY